MHENMECCFMCKYDFRLQMKLIYNGSEVYN